MPRPLTVSANAPHWVRDHTAIIELLHRFIDKIERQQEPKIFAKDTASGIPALFDFDQEPEQLWLLLEDLMANKFGLVSITKKRKLARFDQPYTGAKLMFQIEHESQVRSWLDRPFAKPYSEQWRDTVFEHAHALPNVAAFSNPIKSPDLSVQEMVAGFVAISGELQKAQAKAEKISLRTLSARCFRGDSKFLDKRRYFLENAYPQAKETLEPRAIMLSVYIPAQLNAALFVENFDSFRATVRAVRASPLAHNIAVIYSAGYRSSANLIRQTGNSQFVTINHATESEYQAFSDWWFSDQQHVPVLFWGDLDFEGMGILKALRAKFHNAVVFQAAYAAVLEYHQRGIRHSQTNVHKGDQTDPVQTGCEFADTVLLPAIRDSMSFTDQEVIGESAILAALLEQLSILIEPPSR